MLAFFVDEQLWTLSDGRPKMIEPWVIDDARKKLEQVEKLENPQNGGENRSKSIEIDLNPSDGKNENLFDETPEDE